MEGKEVYFEISAFTVRKKIERTTSEYKMKALIVYRAGKAFLFTYSNVT